MNDLVESNNGSGGVDLPWAFDPEDADITLNGMPVFRVYREWDFPCIEDEDRAAADIEYITHANVAVMLLNRVATTDAETVGEALGVSRICATCNREFQIIPPPDGEWPDCLLPDCRSYDPERDLDGGGPDWNPTPHAGRAPSRKLRSMSHEELVAECCYRGAELVIERERVAIFRRRLNKQLEAVWTDFLDANPDDLTSPEELPDHALVTCQQMIGMVETALEQGEAE